MKSYILALAAVLLLGSGCATTRYRGVASAPNDCSHHHVKKSEVGHLNLVCP